MYISILLTHKLVVLLFIFIYLVKTVFLLIPDKETLSDRINKAVKIPERFFASLMLITGVYLLINTGQTSLLLYLKIGLVFLSIPIAIIGFKRRIKILASLSFLMLLGVYSMAEIHKKRATIIDNTLLATDTEMDVSVQGEKIYQSNCVNCHGTDGALKLSGAKDLRVSDLDFESKAKIIREGKNAMPGYGRQLNDSQVEALIQYIETLK